jgi:hypothetical protein
VGGDLRHVFVGRQFVADLGAVTSRYQDIEVADGIPPPVAACHHDLALPNRLAQRMGKGLRLGFRNREPEALFSGRLCQGCEYLLLDRGAEAACFVKAARLRGAPKILDGTNAEPLHQQFDSLWSERRQGGNIAYFAWKLALERVSRSNLPVLTMPAILPARSLPIPGNSDRSCLEPQTDTIDGVGILTPFLCRGRRQWNPR